MVARDKVASARLMLASKGLPTSGSVGYEIFDNTSALGQTDFVQNLNRQRALEGELARTIRSLDGVTFARVQLVLPKRRAVPGRRRPAHRLGDRSGSGPRALGRPGAGAAEPGRRRGAQPQARPGHHRRPERQASWAAATATPPPARPPTTPSTAIEDRIRRQVKELVEGVVGPGKARVQVTADVDMSQVTTQEEKYDPDGQVVALDPDGRGDRTSRTSPTPPARPRRAPTSRRHAGRASRRPRPRTTPPTAGAPRRPPTTRSPRPRRPPSQPPGTIKRLRWPSPSTASSTPGENGKPGAYSPRSAEEMQHIDDLVTLGGGLLRRPRRPGQRDQRPLRRRRCRPTPPSASSGSKLFDFDKNDLMRDHRAGHSGGGLGPDHLLRRAAAVGHGGQRRRADQLRRHARAGRAWRAAEAASGSAARRGIPASRWRFPAACPGDRAADRHRQIEGQVKASSVKSVAEFVDRPSGGIGLHPPQLAA